MMARIFATDARAFNFTKQMLMVVEGDLGFNIVIMGYFHTSFSLKDR